MISGTKGTFADYPRGSSSTGRRSDAWQELRQRNGRQPGGIEDRYEDPLWKKLAKGAEKSGHGGMDYVMSWRLVECLREGLPPDMDVYDAAAWSAPAALSEQSVAGGNAPVEFPDFTRGRWTASDNSVANRGRTDTRVRGCRTFAPGPRGAQATDPEGVRPSRRLTGAPRTVLLLLLRVRHSATRRLSRWTPRLSSRPTRPGCSSRPRWCC